MNPIRIFPPAFYMLLTAVIMFSYGIYFEDVNTFFTLRVSLASSFAIISIISWLLFIKHKKFISMRADRDYYSEKSSVLESEKWSLMDKLEKANKNHKKITKRKK